MSSRRARNSSKSGGQNKSNGNKSNGNAERLMFVFLGFVVIVGYHHFGLLLQNHNMMDRINKTVKDEPNSDTQSQRRNEQTVPPSEETTTSTTATNTATEADSEKETNDSNVNGNVNVNVNGKGNGNGNGKGNGNIEDDKENCMKGKPLNIALFYADDWTMKVLGKLNEHVKTPNIDAMADKGMIFTNNCVTTSVCWSSRSTLATGAYSAIHKHNMPFDPAKFETKVWDDTLYPLMKRGGSKSKGCRKGYYTGLFGKWHKLEIQNEIKAAFHESRMYYGNHWEERDGEMQHVTELNKKDSVKFLDNWGKVFSHMEEKPPFFLTTSFFATHAEDGNYPSYKPTNSTRVSVYPDSIEIPFPKTATNKHYLELPFFLRSSSEGRTRWQRRFDPYHYQSNIKDIFAMATEVDEAVGAIIDKIKSLGVYDETILIFTTDNGNLHGEHGLAEKWYPFEESLRVPLVIQDPRMPKERWGTTSEAWTLNIDLAPTILGVANIPQSDFMQGRDIADLYLNDAEDKQSLSNEELKEKVGWRKDWFYEFNLGNGNDGKDHPWHGYIDASFALVTDEWKYVFWPEFNYEQLFHRSVDPYDEWDLLNKILRPAGEKETKDFEKLMKNLEGDFDSGNGCCDTVKTTLENYVEMKKRYMVLKNKAQSGERV